MKTSSSHRAGFGVSSMIYFSTALLACSHGGGSNSSSSQPSPDSTRTSADSPPTNPAPTPGDREILTMKDGSVLMINRSTEIATFSPHSLRIRISVAKGSPSLSGLPRAGSLREACDQEREKIEMDYKNDFPAQAEKDGEDFLKNLAGEIQFAPDVLELIQEAQGLLNDRSLNYPIYMQKLTLKAEAWPDISLRQLGNEQSYPDQDLLNSLSAHIGTRPTRLPISVGALCDLSSPQTKIRITKPVPGEIHFQGL